MAAVPFDYLSLQTCLVFAVVFLIIYRFFTTKNHQRLPPGPSCLPIIGNVHKLGGVRIHVVTAKLANQFGGMMTINLAGMKAVMLLDLKTIREAFVEKADQSSDRLQHLLGEYINGHKGYENATKDLKHCLTAQTGTHHNVSETNLHLFQFISRASSLIFENGEGWKSHRHMTLRALRNFGMGKRSLENKINEEARVLAKHFEQQNGRPFNPQPTLQNAVANVICSISFGNRYDYNDAQFRRHLDCMKRNFEELSGPGLVASFPSLWFTPLYRSLRKLNDDCRSFLKRKVEQHKETFDPSDIRDIIDMHLQKNDEDDHNQHKLPESLIWRGIFDLFAAGTQSTSDSILWAILLLTQYQEVQKKMQKEIDDVIGRERPPTLPDRLNMPYVDATIMETQRFRPVACFIPPKITSADTELMGYEIPKGTQIWANLYAVLHSPKHWTHPDEFIPERFLSADGKRTEKPDAFIPFGIGRRICIGELLARVELFLFLTNLLQRFTFHIPEEDPKPNLEGSHGEITLSTGAFRICARSR